FTSLPLSQHGILSYHVQGVMSTVLFLEDTGSQPLFRLLDKQVCSAIFAATDTILSCLLLCFNR
ncbi:hypothetical protein, partial [Dethiobacter alkaliphilus]|uniref:hypothetical protein n=1 Tax=Dethiobacter alkaliphilus TaxID=427926 RepID=UPI0019D70A5F